jgi:large subunit ribosomal protein L31
MREGIHPDYVEATVHCSCGNEFKTKSTSPMLRVELCDMCHPFYTGQQKFVDTGGRVQRFADKFGASAETVVKKEAAAKEARRVAHEESVIAARQARVEREKIEAEAAEKAAARAPKAAPVEDAPVEEAVVEEAVVEEASAEEPVAEAVAVEETPAEQTPAEEPASEDAAE